MNVLSKLFWSAVVGYNYFADREVEYVPPHVDQVLIDERDGERPVIIATAMNYREVGRITEGTTYPGAVMQVNTNMGGNKWKIHYESFRDGIDDIPQPEPKGMTREEYQDYIDKQRGA